MSTPDLAGKHERNFFDIPSAASQAGYSSRHFRRIIEEDRIPVMQIGRKLFIVARDLAAWKSTRGEARLQMALQQVGGQIQQVGGWNNPQVPAATGNEPPKNRKQE